MKDVEFAAHLLLFLELGTKGHSTSSLDQEFSNRDLEWDNKADVEDSFKSTIKTISSLISKDIDGKLSRSRFKNQADFYSLFGALSEITKTGNLKGEDDLLSELGVFADSVDDENARESKDEYGNYYKAARSSSNDSGPRSVRIKILMDIISAG